MSSNFELPPTPSRSSPSKPTGSGSQTSAASVEEVQEDMLADEAMPHNNDEDEKMFPEHVDQHSRLAVVPFVQTDSEEEEENANMLIVDEYDGDEMTKLDWDRNAPGLGLKHPNFHKNIFFAFIACIAFVCAF